MICDKSWQRPLKLFLILALILTISLISLQDSFAQPAENMRILDSFGNSIEQIKKGQQIQIARDISWHLDPTYFLSLDNTCPNPLIIDDQLNCGTPTGYTFGDGKPIFANEKELPFVYIVQISNSDGEVVHLSWLQEEKLEFGEAFTSSISWTPHETGRYTATTFIWKSIDDPVPYTFPVLSTFLVIL